MNYIITPDWDGNPEHGFSDDDPDFMHPLLLHMLNTEQWVASDHDLSLAIALLRSTQRARRGN